MRKKLGKINLTLLDPYTIAEKHGPIHRDYLAHCFRWAFVGRLIKRDMAILDVGAGTGNLAETLYRNRLKPKVYVAIELKPSFVQELIKLSKIVNFPMVIYDKDVRIFVYPDEFENFFDIVCCFEVIEHFESYWEKPYLKHMLLQLKRVVKPNGNILLSTPNYDGIHKAANHIYEYRESELQTIFYSLGFQIEGKYGTFMSLGRPQQAKKILTEEEFIVYKNLYRYYNSSILSIIFAPLHPSQSRNILWVLKK